MPAMFLLFIALNATGLAYGLWRTQADWEQSGFGWRVAFGLAAALGAFLSVAFAVTGLALSNL
ncbi:hypothetical protein LZ496_03945 [Sphingomonas sp. NSE70-1]|uniref:Uncharacterized protein n=1 Tax=Sphingomonas caseinilyticus TaxID=2908205 RepID=A0ABT0RSW2_9SPHN|nr:hypothetical protein [Sphingomonas caseinilyticus]MCL6697936.1 hypothetical protein [Sphingomonas caseinilyticus]